MSVRGASAWTRSLFIAALLLADACRKPNLSAYEREQEVRAQRRQQQVPLHPARTETGAVDANSPWASRGACLTRLASGERWPKAADRARVLAWNVRWFPDGRPGRSESATPTDLEWLACTLAFLQPDVIALEEIKAHNRARQKLSELLTRLSTLSGGEFHVELDPCPEDPTQHVALLWNSRRVRADQFETFAGFNPLATPCQDHLRPGLGGRFRFPGGLDLEVIAVHLKSGTERRAISLRERALSSLPEAFERVARRYGDDDLLVLGDFNVMGCPRCSPPIEPDAERRAVASALAAFSTPFSLLPSRPGCSHYFSGKAGLLDLAIAPKAMRELGEAPEVQVFGLCRELDCRPMPRQPENSAYRELSDHCPIMLDLLDRDLD